MTDSAFCFIVPVKRSSHYIKGLLIGAISTAGFVLVILLVLMWTRLVSKKERTAKSYLEVKKQNTRESSELHSYGEFLFKRMLQLTTLTIQCRCQAHYIPW